MNRTAICDEVMKLDKKISYRDYKVLPGMTPGGKFRAKILHKGRVICTTRPQANKYLMELDAKHVIQKIMYSNPQKEKEKMTDKTGRDLAVEAIRTMPRYDDALDLNDNQVTIKLMAKLLSESEKKPVSESITKNRLGRLVKQGKMKMSKNGNRIIYTWIDLD